MIGKYYEDTHQGRLNHLHNSQTDKSNGWGYKRDLVEITSFTIHSPSKRTILQLVNILRIHDTTVRIIDHDDLSLLLQNGKSRIYFSRAKLLVKCFACMDINATVQHVVSVSIIRVTTKTRGYSPMDIRDFSHRMFKEKVNIAVNSLQRCGK